jgi:hypothetical protein
MHRRGARASPQLRKAEKRERATRCYDERIIRRMDVPTGRRQRASRQSVMQARRHAGAGHGHGHRPSNIDHRPSTIDHRTSNIEHRT